MIKKNMWISAMALAMFLAMNTAPVYASEGMSEGEELSYSSSESVTEEESAEQSQIADADIPEDVSEEYPPNDEDDTNSEESASEQIPAIDAEEDAIVPQPADGEEAEDHEPEEGDLEISLAENEEEDTPTLHLASENKKNGLIEENGQIYFYTNDVRHIGQKKVGSFWYMFDPATDGAMVKGFYTHTEETNPNGGAKTCYYDASGHMVYGQQKIGGYWYNFKQGNGAMQTGFVRIPEQNKIVYYNEGGSMGKGLGRMLYGQRKIDGYWYLFKQGNGAMQTGFVTIADQNKTVYYSESGAMAKGLGRMLYGAQKIGGTWHYLKPGSGALAGTGVFETTVDGTSGYWYFVNGKIEQRINRAVTYNGADWNVMSSRATRVSSNEDRALFKALKVVASITNDSMTKAQKLKRSFDHIKTYSESSPWIPDYKGIDWPQKYANNMFDRKTGDCLSYAAAFAYMAKACGYTTVYGCHDGAHGWAEIDGLVYDPEWSKHMFYSTFYGISYDTPTDSLQNYPLVLSASKRNPWMRVKI